MRKRILSFVLSAALLLAPVASVAEETAASYYAGELTTTAIGDSYSAGNQINLDAVLGMSLDEGVTDGTLKAVASLLGKSRLHMSFYDDFGTARLHAELNTDDVTLLSADALVYEDGSAQIMTSLTGKLVLALPAQDTQAQTVSMADYDFGDPAQVEAAGVTEISGMGLMDMDTEFRGEKVQTQTQGVLHGVEGMLSPLNGLAYEGYEIHMGRSRQAMPALSGGGNVYGSYVHGIFDAPGIADTILRALCARKGVSFDALATFDARGYKERQYDLLADVVRGGLDMSFVYRVLHREV